MMRGSTEMRIKGDNAKILGDGETVTGRNEVVCVR